MKTSPTKSIANLIAIAALTFAAPVFQAHASDLRMTVEQPRFTCEGSHSALSHVAFHPGDDLKTVAAPLPCCNGQLGCAQFLSTNTIVRQSHEWHG